MSPIESRTRAILVNSLLGPTAAPVPGKLRDVQREVTLESEQTSDGSQPDPIKDLVAKARETSDPLRISPEEAAFVVDPVTRESGAA
jgi:hypothetical protein